MNRRKCPQSILPIQVLILNPYIPEYRFPIFNMIADYYDLTIAHSGESRTEPNIKFKQIIIPRLKLGPFSCYRANINNLCKNFDIVISEGNIRYLDRNLLIINPFRKYKWINWGIGVSASYNKQYDQNKRWDLFRNFIFQRADAQVFYSEYPINKYISAGFDQESLFVANNTCSVIFDKTKVYKKSKFIFVGTVYKQKKLDELLSAYLLYSQKSPTILPLEIIGDGDNLRNLQSWVKENKLTEHVTFHGSIYDQKCLERHHREAYASISPGQAGLSILTSMGFGTPYICRSDAITGGEIFNLENSNTGVRYETKEDLVNTLYDITQNPQKYEIMGARARNYYLRKRMPQHMVSSIIEACKYVTSKC
jgi:glycosyltransferase involved in cell wall biosynthesis